MIIYLMLILPLICVALIYFVPDRLIKIANLAFALVICAVIFKAIRPLQPEVRKAGFHRINEKTSEGLEDRFYRGL